MLSKKLISLLESFSKHDLNRFGKYLHSPFFNEKEDLRSLFEIIDQALRSNRSQRARQLDKKAVWKQLHGKEAFDDGRLRRLSSDLTRHAYQYLALIEYQSDPVREQVLLLRWLQRHHLNDKHFNGTIRKARHLQEKKPLEGATYHYEQYFIEEAQHEHETQSDKKTEYLEQADYHLECFYITRKLKHFSDALHYKKSGSTQADIEIPQAFLGYVKSKYLSEPSVRAYYLVAQMLMNPEAENHYRELKEFLREHSEKFRVSELGTLYGYLKNYCIEHKIKEGRQDFLGELFDLVKTLQDKEALSDTGVLDAEDYDYVIKAGMEADAVDWVENFIQQYGGKETKDAKEATGSYGMAKMYFQQGEFQKVVDQLREMKVKKSSHVLEGKLMLLKSYYELEDQLLMSSLTESLRIYLRRNRSVSKKEKEQYHNFLDFVEELSKAIPGDVEAAKKLRQKIERTKKLAEKPWLLEKVEALKKD